MSIFPRWPRRRGKPARRPRRTSFRLHVEPLEQRALLSLDLLGQWNQAITPAYSDGWVVDNLAFLVHFGPREGIHVIDVSDPTVPVKISTFVSPDTTNDYRDVEVQWQLVKDEWRLIGYASGDGLDSAQWQNGVVVVDFTDPYKPVQLFKITAAHGGTNTVHTLCVRGDYLYEADSRTPTIRVFNVADPSNPYWVRNIVTSIGVKDPVHEVTEQWGRLYTANIFGTFSVDIYDVSAIGEPGNPVTQLGRVAGAGVVGEWPHTAWPTDDGLYMATTREASGGTLGFWDISDPAAPRLLWEIGRPTTETCCVHQVMIRGNYLFASWYAAGVYVYDISDPHNPVEVGSYDTYPGGGDIRTGAWGIFGFWDDPRVFAFDRQQGLFIFQLNPEAGPGAGGGAFAGSTSRAVRGRWAEGRGVEAFRDEQLARVTGDTLTLTLGAGNDTVHVRRGDDGRSIDVTVNGTRQFRFDAAPLRQLNVRALEGDDRIVLDPNLGLQLFLDGGPGHDVIEGWRDDYVNPSVQQAGNHHAANFVPYQAVAAEQFVHVRAGTNATRVLDNHAHQMIQHAAGAAPFDPDALPTRTAGHAGGDRPGGAAAVPALTAGGHAAGAAQGVHVWGVPKQVVWHKPG